MNECSKHSIIHHFSCLLLFVTVIAIFLPFYLYLYKNVWMFSRFFLICIKGCFQVYCSYEFTTSDFQTFPILNLLIYTPIRTWRFLITSPKVTSFSPIPTSKYILKMLFSVYTFIWRCSPFLVKDVTKFDPRDSYKNNSSTKKCVLVNTVFLYIVT